MTPDTLYSDGGLSVVMNAHMQNTGGCCYNIKGMSIARSVWRNLENE